jgi:anti-sigma-K factor RskA
MTKSSTPESIDLLMAGYIVGDLTAAELIEFKRLLAQHPKLAQEINQLDATCDRVMTGPHEVQPPPHLWANIRTQIDRQSIGQIQPAGQRSLP